MDKLKNCSSIGLSRPELWDFYKHCDNVATSKERLFISIAFAIIPALILKWHEVTTLVAGTAAISSIIFYFYHYLVLKRFEVLQEKIFERIGRETPDFNNIVSHPGKLGVQKLRKIFFWILVCLWVGLISLHILTVGRVI